MCGCRKGIVRETFEKPTVRKALTVAHFIPFAIGPCMGYIGAQFVAGKREGVLGRSRRPVRRS